MFYLLVTGGSGTNDKSNAYSVTGIGLTEADADHYTAAILFILLQLLNMLTGAQLV